MITFATLHSVSPAVTGVLVNSPNFSMRSNTFSNKFSAISPENLTRIVLRIHLVIVFSYRVLRVMFAQSNTFRFESCHSLDGCSPFNGHFPWTSWHEALSSARDSESLHTANLAVKNFPLSCHAVRLCGLPLCRDLSELCLSLPF